jgi:CO/xanthine dehydrogenase FAD-binding subunit
MTYHTPATLEAAFDAMARDGASPIAGGTDWYPSRGERLTGEAMLDVTRLPGFRGISRTAQGWRIGAATRWTDIIRADLPPSFDGLKAAAREVGSVQIQNAGTIAGNLCNASPAADGVPPLLTLEASVEVLSRGGMRMVPLEHFITGVRRTDLRPGELVGAIHVPATVAGQGGFRKAGGRKYLVISIAMVAVLVRVEEDHIAEARVAVGACSPVACRLPALEAALSGSDVRAPLPEVTAGHLAPLTPISDIRGSAEYRAEVVAALIERTLAKALGGVAT